MNGLTALLALELAALGRGQVLAVSGGAGLLARYTIAAARQQGIRVVADAKPAEKALVERYGAEIVVERGPDFAGAIRKVLPDGVAALLDTAVLGERALGALRDGGVYIPVRGWEDKPSERDIRIRPVWVHTVLERTEWLDQLRGLVSAGQLELIVTNEYAPERTGDAQHALEAGGLRCRPVLTF
jgi:NADPH:quinone reductase-like Zn-dependent oxidoreductase